MSQVDFWSSNPCGADGEFSQIIEQRYRLEPWLPRDLRTIPSNRGKYLEIGCGQGADAFLICSTLNKDDEYHAVDYSKESIRRAVTFVDDAKQHLNLRVTPRFAWGDALNLQYSDCEFDFIYSMGVIHHTPAPQKAIDEVFRVLKSGGHARIFLYRRGSPKVGAAKVLRLTQGLADKILRQERCIYKLLSRKKSKFFGSMVLECFGVPWMEWYSEKDLRTMFRNYSSVDIQPFGYNFPRFSKMEIDGYNNFGVFYKIEARK
ncbi:MAG: class I SAM-dependent methyltransferase [Rhodospirillales bacterium]|nr:class I SAM-dependent methyltransferase [Rhodospirillales bacterium]